MKGITYVFLYILVFRLFSYNKVVPVISHGLKNTPLLVAQKCSWLFILFLVYVAMWHKAKKVSLVSGQTEVKMEFPLPIVACNLMIEYADFYENLQASSESLQCPRCSSSVPANPGVCANCGENVFQCHKCRFVYCLLLLLFIVTNRLH